MLTNRIRVPLIAAGGAVAAIALSACGSSGVSAAAGSTATTSTPPAASTTQPAAAKGTKLTATETEFKITLSSTTLSPGTYTIKVTNAGQITHALTVNGPGVPNKSTPDLAPGSSATLTVTLKAGSYDVYCPVGDHKMEGMNDTVKVA